MGNVDDCAQDIELNLYATVEDAGLKQGAIIAVKYSDRRGELISTKDIAGCWCCVCAPCMCTACFRKVADGPDGLIHKGCVVFPFPFPFNEPRRRQGQTNNFAKHDDPNNLDR